MKLVEIVLLFLVVFVVGSESQFSNDTETNTTMKHFASEKTPVKKHRQSSYEDESGFNFIVDLYDRIASDAGKGNVILSPFSVASVLALTLEGARGTTAEQMQSVLHWNSVDTVGVRESIRNALRSMNRATRSYILTVVNHVFLQEGFQPLPAFRHHLRSYHLSDVDVLDFSKEEKARSAINRWVSRATKNHIPELIAPDSLDQQTRVLLLNAVYFKGDWAIQFDEKRTQPRPFFPEANREIMTPMMYTQAEFGYAQIDELQCSMLELPYRGRDLAMYLLLPDAPDGLARLRGALWNHPAIFYAPESILEKQNVTVLLPKFRLEHSLKLKPALVHMGIQDLFFQGKADLSGMAGANDLYVSDIVHKAFIEVNEKGTKAAAVSAVTIRGRMMQAETIFRADHPFMFFIQDKKTKTVLFIGHVMDLPEAKS